MAEGAQEANVTFQGKSVKFKVEPNDMMVDSSEIVHSDDEDESFSSRLVHMKPLIAFRLVGLKGS